MGSLRRSHKQSPLLADRRHRRLELSLSSKPLMHLPPIPHLARGSSRSTKRKRANQLSPNLLTSELQVKREHRDIVGFTKLLIDHKEVWSLACALRCVQFVGAEVYKLVPNLLITLGKMCLSSGKYRDAANVFKCALEYTWYSDEFESELEVYDCLGVAHYYLGEIKMARLYHRRYLSGRHEPMTSSIRRRAIFNLTKHAKPNALGIFSKYFDE